MDGSRHDSTQPTTNPRVECHPPPSPYEQVGQAYELFVPLHIGAVGMHALKGQNIMRRMGVTAFG
jgi:hypothetical protein